MDEPLFLKVRQGDVVLIKQFKQEQVFTSIVGSRDPEAPTLFQIANVYSGDEVANIVTKNRTTTKRPSALYEQIHQPEKKQ